MKWDYEKRIEQLEARITKLETIITHQYEDNVDCVAELDSLKKHITELESENQKLKDEKLFYEDWMKNSVGYRDMMVWDDICKDYPYLKATREESKESG